MSRIKLTLAPLYGAQAKSGTPQQTLTLTLMGYVVQGTAGGGPDGVGLPAGGSPGQALVKRSTTNFDAMWGNPLAPKWGELDGQIGDQEDLAQALAGKAAETHDHDGRYLKPEDLPALGSAASSDVSDFATAAQGAKADTALQGGAGLSALDAAAASKLGSVSPNATANDTDANLRDRATHTGEQPLSSLSQSGATPGQVAVWDGTRWTPGNVSTGGSPSQISWGGIQGNLFDQADLRSALDAKLDRTGVAPVALTGAYGSLSGLPSLGSASERELEDFASATQGAKADTALQGGAGLAALDSAAASKLSGIAPGATANDPDADLRDRATHTGVQPLDSLARGGAADGDVIQWDAALGRWVAGVSSSRAELMVSDTDSPPVILTNEDATDFLYSD